MAKPLSATFTPYTSLGIQNELGNRSWCDVDNDGDLDVLMPGYTNYLYLNELNGIFSRRLIALPPLLQETCVMAWADYDDDGWSDLLICGETYGDERVTRLLHNEFGTDFTILPAVFTGVVNGSPEFGDYDNDNDLDILLGGTQGPSSYISKIYRNDGAGIFTDIGFSLNSTGIREVDWLDIDHDNDLDIVPRGYAHPLVIHVNQGNSIYTSINTGMTYNYFYWADYDNDQDLDIFAMASVPAIELYANNGNNQFSQVPDAFPWGMPTSQGGVDFCDYDNDGWTDVLTNYALFRNTGSGTFIDQELGSIFTASGMAGWIDHNADGLWDIWTCSDMFGSGVKLIEGSQSDSSYTFTELATWIPELNSISCMWGDQDGDEDMDLMLWGVPMNQRSRSFLYCNEEGLFHDLLWRLPVANDLKFGDFDCDGDHDILLADYEAIDMIGGYEVFSNQGGAFRYEANVSGMLVAQPGSAISDYDNDGDIDILCYDKASLSSSLTLYRNDGDSAYTAMSVPLPQGCITMTAWIDHDNDGDQDLLICYTDNHDPYNSDPNNAGHTYILRNDNGCFTSTRIGLDAVRIFELALADFDLDRDLDLIVSGSIMVADDLGNLFPSQFSTPYLNDGAGVFVPATAQLPNFMYRVMCGDYDNDGDPDLIYYTSANLKLLRNNGNLEFETSMAVANLNLYSICDGDLDNDGDLDLYCKYVNQIYELEEGLFINDGNGGFSPEGMGLGTPSFAEAAVSCDYTRDGRLDLAVFRASVTGIPSDPLLLYRNNTTTANSAPAMPTNLTTEVQGDYVIFHWAPASDVQTPTGGLSYSLRVGTSPGGCDVMSPLALGSGFRLMPGRGTIQACSWKLQKSRFEYHTPYYWSVQAIDSFGAGSPFADEAVFGLYTFGAPNTQGFLPFSASFEVQGDFVSSTFDYFWQFGDGGTSTAMNPSHTYLYPGSYTVSLTIDDGQNVRTYTRVGYILTSINPDQIIYVTPGRNTIQSAINAADPGDYILIADGVYYENLLVEGIEITIASMFFVDGDSTHIANTIIDGGQAINPAQASVFTFLPGTNPYFQPHVAGLTIRNGSGRQIIQNIEGVSVVKRVGGGLFCSQANPIFSHDRIHDNVAVDEGGGSYALQSLPNFGGQIGDIYNPGNNVFYENEADVGRDMYFNNPPQREVIRAQNCHFEVFCSSDTTLTDYWSTTPTSISYSGSSGNEDTINSDIYVATNGSDTLNSGLNASSPFKTIDRALSRAYGTAQNPVTIHIAAGIYSLNQTGERYPLQMVKWVSLQGEGPDNTILDAEGSSLAPTRLIVCDGVEGVSISGLSLQNGYVTSDRYMHGGGIAVFGSQISLVGLNIENCVSAGNGGGIYAYESSVTGDSLSVIFNQSSGSGGGIYASASGFALGNSILSNNSTFNNGGGMYGSGQPISLNNNQISYNYATGNQKRGGGLYLTASEDPFLRGNTISNNTAFTGGGCALQNCNGLDMGRNMICNNLANSWGGGIFDLAATGSVNNNLIANNTAAQRGGGIYCGSDLDYINNTLANNRANSQGGGIYNISSHPSFTNCIAWGNSAPANAGAQLYIGSASIADFLYCDIQGGSAAFNGSPYTGTYEDNADDNPLFVNPTSGAGINYSAIDADFSLMEGSPCVNSGDPDTSVTNMPLDLAGNLRMSGIAIDQGAYEYQIILNLEPPQNVSIAIENGMLILAWDQVAGATAYRIYSNDDPSDTSLTEIPISSGELNQQGNRCSWSIPLPAAPRQFYLITAEGSRRRGSLIRIAGK
jgi:parallel beta-helix repeat protein/predicted outer membrane repeat protein